MKLRDRNVKLGFVGIIDLKELSRAVRRIHRGKTAVAADAVLQVHDRVTDFQLRQITDHHVDVAFAFGASAFSSDRAFAARIKFGFRQNGDRRILKMHSVIERSVAEREFLAAFKERFEILRGRNRKFVFFQDFGNGFEASCGIGHDQEPAASNLGKIPVGSEAFKRIVLASFDGNIGKIGLLVQSVKKH